MALVICLLFLASIYASTLKFGYDFKISDGSFLKKNFVAFGSVPENTTDLELKLISDELDRFHQNYQSAYKDLKEFHVEVIEEILLRNGNHQIALKGDLSSFLAFFAFTIFNTLSKPDIWMKVKFYSDPVIIMSRESFSKYPNGFVIDLLGAGFDKNEIIPTNRLQIMEHPNIGTSDMRHGTISDDSSDLKSDHYTLIDLNSLNGSLDYPLLNNQKQSKSTICSCSYCNIS